MSTKKARPPVTDAFENAFVGRFVIIRSDQSGVHAGVLHARSGATVWLKGSRRIWQWSSPPGRCLLSLNEVSHYGVGPASKLSVVVDDILLVTPGNDACEVLPCTPEAEANIRTHSAWGAPTPPNKN